MNPPETSPTYLDAEGWEIDEATGEVLRHVAFTPDFQVTSDDHAEAVLAAYLRTEARTLALTEELAAITRNFQSLINDQARRRAYLDFRFHAALIAHARGRLAGQCRTAKFKHGQVSFRTVPPKTTIVDMAAAVAFVETFAPAEVSRPEPTVNLKAVQAARLEAARQTGEDERPAFLAVTEPAETASIKTGIGRSKTQEDE